MTISRLVAFVHVPDVSLVVVATLHPTLVELAEADAVRTLVHPLGNDGAVVALR
jgi:hypothetical protein